MALLDVIKTAIVDREEELKLQFVNEHIIEREAAEGIKLVAGSALVITGVRRCGKSILAYTLSQGKGAYVNFEDERLNISSAELNVVLEAIYSLKGNVDVIIFDEIQNVSGWERFVARLLPSKKVVITGSNARLLSRELSTFLTGRHIDVALFPFSFREFCTWKKFEPGHSTKDIVQVKEYLSEYIEKGGFPLAHKIGNVFLLELYKDILERDIIQRYKIRHVKAFKDIAKYVIFNYSRELSYSQLRRVFGVKSVHTVKNYLSYLQSAYLILLVERFSFKLKEQALAPKKAYCIDTGMMNAVGFQFSKNSGLILENMVAVELWRQSQEVYYWKDNQHREVDFVVKKGRKVVQLIQACKDVQHIGTKEREITSLIAAGKELRCNNLIVITDDYDAEEKHGEEKIRFIPLWKWLLNVEG